jgi:hypothetical protein
MDKNDNVQSPPSGTGEAPATDAQPASTSAVSNTGTPSTALGNAGFLQSIQQRFDSMGDEVGSLFGGKYDSLYSFSSILILNRKQNAIQIQK